MKQATAAEVTRFRRWREERGYTLDEVSGLCGLSATYLSRVERGERRLPPGMKVEVSRRLGARIADLFEVEPLVDEAVS